MSFLALRRSLPKLLKTALILFLGLYLVWLGFWLLPGKAAALTVTDTPAMVTTADETEPMLLSPNLQTQYEGTFPFWLWLVLPRLFPEYLTDKGGYLALGLTWEPGAALPIGVERFQSGNLSQEHLSCKSCHLLKEGTAADTPPALRLANVSFSHERYHQFLMDCVSDPRFTADYLLSAIDYNVRMPWLRKQIYRWVTIPQLKAKFLNRVLQK